MKFRFTMAIDPKFIGEFQEIKRYRDQIRHDETNELYAVHEEYERKVIMIYNKYKKKMDSVLDLDVFAEQHPSDAELVRREVVDELIKSGCVNATNWDRYGAGYYIHIEQKGFKTTIISSWVEKKLSDEVIKKLKSHGFSVKYDYLKNYIGPN